MSSLITPWASLAIILWYERCRAGSVHISWSRFAATGAVCAVTTFAAAQAPLLLTV